MSQYSSSWDECLSCRNMCQGLDYIFYSDDEESEKKEWRLLQNFDKKNNQIWIYITFLSNFWELPTFEESNTEEWKHKEWKLTLLWSRICWIFMSDAGMYFFLKKWLLKKMIIFISSCSLERHNTSLNWFRILEY